jgi:hypothetical protein
MVLRGSSRPAALFVCCVGEPMLVEWAARAVERQRCAKGPPSQNFAPAHEKAWEDQRTAVYPKQIPRRDRGLIVVWQRDGSVNLWRTWHHQRSR